MSSILIDGGYSDDSNIKSLKKIVAFPWGVTSTGPGGFMVVCVL